MKGVIGAALKEGMMSPGGDGSNGVTDEDIKKAQSGQTGMKQGGKVSSASKRADGCAVKGKTKGRMI